MYRHLQAGVHIAPLCEGMAVLTMHDDQYFLLNDAQSRALMQMLGAGAWADIDEETLARWASAFDRQGLLRAGTFDTPDDAAVYAARREVEPLAGFTGWRLDPEDLGPGLPLWLTARAWWAVRQSHHITARTRMPGLLRWLYGASPGNRTVRSWSALKGGATAARGIPIMPSDATTVTAGNTTAYTAAQSEPSSMEASADFADRISAEACIAQTVGALNRACLLYPKRTKCLEWSAALVHLCQQRGVDVDLVIGVSGGPFSAHAWVEHEGKVIGDDAERRKQFAVIVDGRTLRENTVRRDADTARRDRPRDNARETTVPRGSTSPAGA